MSTIKQPLVDRLGRTVTVGDRVAYASYRNGFAIGRVVKAGRIRAYIVAEDPSWFTEPEAIGAADTVKV